MCVSHHEAKAIKVAGSNQVQLCWPLHHVALSHEFIEEYNPFVGVGGTRSASLTDDVTAVSSDKGCPSLKVSYIGAARLHG